MSQHGRRGQTCDSYSVNETYIAWQTLNETVMTESEEQLGPATTTTITWLVPLRNSVCALDWMT